MTLETHAQTSDLLRKLYTIGLRIGVLTKLIQTPHRTELLASIAKYKYTSKYTGKQQPNAAYTRAPAADLALVLPAFGCSYIIQPSVKTREGYKIAEWVSMAFCWSVYRRHTKKEANSA